MRGNTFVTRKNESQCTITITYPVMLKSKTVDQLVRNSPNIKPSEVQSLFVLSAFQEQKEWADVESEAASTIDRKWISNVKKSLRVT